MQVLNPINKKRKHFCKVKKLSSVFFLVSLITFFSTTANGQTACNGIIDNTRNDYCLGYGTALTFSNAVAAGQNIEWLTSGDGTFNNRFAQQPTYTPGPADSVNGYVYIYLDAYTDDPAYFCSALPVSTIYFSNMRSTATPATQTVCSGAAITNVLLSGAVSGIVYNWTRDNTASITGIAASGTGTIRGALVNTGTMPVTVTFTITPTVNSCTGTPITATVIVNPRVIATASITSQNICSRANITAIALSSTANNTTYSWTRNNTSTLTGISSSGTGNITGALTNNGGSSATTTFTITPSAYTCTGTAITSTVTVSSSSTPVTTTNAVQTICSGSNISTISSSGAGSGATYNWTRNNTASVTGIASSGSGSITGSLTNTTIAPLYVTFTITPTTNSCANRANVLVSPAPVAVATPSSQTVCSGTPLSAITFSSLMSGATYNWTRNNTGSVTGIASSGSGTIAGTLNNTTSSPVTVTFTITPTANGCTGSAITATVVVNPIPGTPTATPSSQTICSGGSITNIVLSGSGTGITYNWTRDNTASVTGIAGSGSGNITGSLVNTTASSVTVTFTITPTNGCNGNSRTATVVVNPSAGTAIATPSSQTICSGAGITSIISSGISGATYNWTRNNTASVTGIANNGSGNITGSLTNTTASPVTVTFTITPVVSGCSAAPVASTVLVNPRPTSVVSGSQNLCAGNPSPNISITLTGASPWTFTYTDGTTPVPVIGNTVNPYTFTVPAVARTYTVTALSDANCTAQAGNMTGSAILTQLTYGIMASAGSNGNITPAGVTNVNCGTSQAYAITANSGYTIQNVLVDGLPVGAVSTYTFNNVTAAHTISATFTSASLNITASAGSNGSITPSGVVGVTSGSNQTFNITANSCYQIAGVLVDGISVGAVSTYTFNNVTLPHTISASFSQLSYNITASAGANGSITPTGVTSVACGSSQTYNIAANGGFAIQDVLVDGISVGVVSSYTFTNVTAVHTISATFVAAAVTITASAGSNGSITPSGSVGVTSGANQIFNIAANSCYQIADVLVDGISVGVVSSYTFTNVTVPHTISASFSQLSYNITASAGSNGSITPNGVTSVSCGGSQ
ncbi:MAG: PKD-like domain-containing protein, partial [Bacteroidota bacterium]